MAAKKKKKRAAKRKPATRSAPKKRKAGKRKSGKGKKRLPKGLAAAMAAFSGESRHDDSYVPPAQRAKRLSKKQRKALAAAAMAAWSGESRHSDVSAPVAAVVAKAKSKRLTKKEKAQLLKAAMGAFSGESRHGPEAEYRELMGQLGAAMEKREHLVSTSKKRYHNPRRRRHSRNPIHFPKSARGRPARKSYWILDVYKGDKITTYIGARPIDKTTAKLMAMQRMNQLKAEKVALSGPYKLKPKRSTLRK